MSPGAIIAGRVVDERGEPVARANVQAHTFQYVNGNRMLAPVSQSAVPSEGFSMPLRASTDDRGEYRLFWLAPGEYYISVTARSQVSASSTADIGALPSPERGLGPMMFGRQSPESWSPIYYPGVTDPEAASRVTVAAASEVRGIDFVWRPVRMPTIRGRWVISAPPAQTPQPSGTIRVQREGGTMMLTRITGGRVPVSSSGSSGDQFEIRGVPPGSYYMNIVQTRNELTFLGRTRVEVGDADVTMSPSCFSRLQIYEDESFSSRVRRHRFK